MSTFTDDKSAVPVCEGDISRKENMSSNGSPNKSLSKDEIIAELMKVLIYTIRFLVVVINLSGVYFCLGCSQ